MPADYDSTDYYFSLVVLKRLDDSSDQVRSYAVQTICTLFKCRPDPYDTVVFGAHIDALYAAMLIHLDDPDETFRNEMLGELKVCELVNNSFSLCLVLSVSGRR